MWFIDIASVCSNVETERSNVETEPRREPCGCVRVCMRAYMRACVHVYACMCKMLCDKECSAYLVNM